MKNLNTFKCVMLVALGLLVGCGEDSVNTVKPEKRGTAKIREAGVKKPRSIRVNGGGQKDEKTGKAPKPELELNDDEDSRRSPEERALAEAIEKALDEEKLEDALACARKAQKSRDTEIRQAMVDTLGWFGVKALPELTAFLEDPNEDVRDSARNEWSSAVADVEDEAERIGAVEMVMSVVHDEDFLDDISGEYIGIDERIAVASLARLITGGGSKQGIAQAKESYELVTGNDWISVAEAEKYLADPDNYEPPENP